jgi:hypothetical protein
MQMMRLIRPWAVLKRSLAYSITARVVRVAAPSASSARLLCCSRNASDILAGKLVRLFEHSLRVSYCHYAVYPISSESNPALVAFRDWPIEQARRTLGG